MSQVFFLVADAAGTILGNGSCPQAHLQWQTPPEGGTLALVERDLAAAVFAARERWRIFGGAPVERAEIAAVASKASIAADGVDAAVISGFPAGCTLRITGAIALGPVVLAADGDSDPLEIASSRPGRIAVELRLDPTHAPWRFAIDAAV